MREPMAGRGVTLAADGVTGLNPRAKSGGPAIGLAGEIKLDYANDGFGAEISVPLDRGRPS